MSHVEDEEKEKCHVEDEEKERCHVEDEENEKCHVEDEEKERCHVEDEENEKCHVEDEEKEKCAREDEKTETTKEMSEKHNELKECQADIQLESRLEDNGLELGYWLKELKEIGITNIQALQYVGTEDFSSLENKIRYPWEKKSLWNLFGIPESGTKIAEVQEKQAQVLKERNEEASKILKQLKVLRSKNKRLQDKDVFQKVEEMQKLLEIPTESSVPPNKTLGELVDYFEKQHFLRVEASSKTDHFTDKEVIKNSSAGLALEGIFYTKNIQDYFKNREQLLCVPEDFHLLSPEQSPCFSQKEFSSQEGEYNYKKTIEKLGLSFSMSLAFIIEDFYLSLGIDGGISSISENSTSSSSDHTYISATRYNYVPLASYYFTQNQLRLSEGALKELKEIEKLNCISKDIEIIRSKCNAFFQRFGSHASLGPIHFGGIYWMKASMERVHKNNINEAKTSTHKALNVIMSGYDAEAAGDIAASYTDTSGSADRSKKLELNSQVEISVSTTGGPLDADSLPHWKAGLVTSNKSWSVIDRGFQLIPIWRIIVSNHKNEFADVVKLSSCLMDSYKSLTGLSSEMIVGEQLLIAFDETQVFMKGVKSWDPKNAKTHLNDLLGFKKKINGLTKSDSTWVNVCLSDKSLQTFLVNVAETYKSDFSYDTDIIKDLMQELLDPHIYSTEDFPEARLLMKWIYDSEYHKLDVVDISNFTELCSVLQQSRDIILHVTMDPKSSKEEVHKTRIRAVLNISLSLYSFLRILRNTGQTETELLILCIANNSGYCVENHNFQIVLGHKEIEFLQDHLDETYKEYRNLKNQSGQWAQAFVLYTGLTSMGQYSEISSQQKTERLNFMIKHLSSSLFPAVKDILNQNSGNYEVIQNKLRAYSNGNAVQEDIQAQDLVRQLSQLYQEEKPSTEILDIVDISNNREDFVMLLKDLALEKYYPQKMKKSDFHTVSSAMLSGAQPSENGKLPIYFLQKLLMMDYSARYVHCENKGEEPQPNTGTMNDDNTIGSPGNLIQNFFSINKKITEKHIVNQVQHIHPMDVQMAIFHCADDFMRQYIYNKLSFCQFALPILVPDPNTKSIGFPLWAFQDVKKQWKTKHGDDTKKSKLNDTFIKDTAAPIVSFIRLGPSAFSKSQTMNWLMSKHRHDIFYHRHCEGSTKNSLLMDGVTEIAWYCPGGREDDVFDNCTAFLNLHGDARDHSPQLEFIQEISSVLVIVLTGSDLEDSKSASVIEQLITSAKPCAFLLVDEELSDSRTPHKLKIGVKDKNEAELIKEVRRKIQELLLLQKEVYSLNQCATCARSHGFTIDEDKVQCKVGKEQAETLLKLLKTKDLSDRKNTFLPLQGDLWRQWCRKDKEMNRLGGKIHLTIEQQRSDIETKKEALRREQLKRAIPLNIFMKDFLQILYSNEQGSNMYFLQWFKMYLDELSLQDLSGLYKKYHSLWLKVKEEKEVEKNKKNIDRREKKLQELSNLIKDSMLGLEHVLRELGQIYEALEANTQDQVISNLPKIGANLMIWGYPIELMDGDAAHVPLKWITAILHELKETLGDKKLFVLSVLGIQSTGKSTLLNAMFGLQFAVSAGRCTRGAFMQLVKVEEELQKKLNYDYVLVVDTEGLRSVESSNKNGFNHDNELATFVIGLGNLTLINIFGENPSEIQDMLQIAVQAFLRMKQVNLNPSCLFIHQNVGEITANEKNMKGQTCLEKKLDEMTVCAAEQEECDATCFNDVIKFDVRTHIHYFAHLWEGDPPMAPPNTRYSQNVQTLRKVILDSGKSNYSILSISDLSRRVTDLWKALLNENFVFSFKNSLEIAAYNQLEVKYSQWQWELRKHMLTLQNEINNQIRKGKIKFIDVILINEKINEVYSAVQEDIKVFFDESKEKNILVQWRKNTETRIAVLKDELIQEAKEKANELISSTERNRKIDARKRKYEDEIYARSKELALSLKGQNLNDENIEKKFNISWNCWIVEVAGDVAPPHSPDIQGDLDKILLDYFKKEVNLSNTIRESHKWKNVTDEFSNFVSNKTKYYFMSETLSDNKKAQISYVGNIIKQRIDEYIDEKERKKLDYQRSYFHEILEIIKQKLNTMFDKKFKFLSDYILYVSLFLCQKAVHRFEKLSAAYRKANEPVAYLESKWEEFYTSFKVSCEAKLEVASLADIISNTIKVSFQEAVYEKSAIDVSNDMKCNYPALNGNRSNLELYLLKSLAEKESFENYLKYFTDPKSAVKDFIKECIEDYMRDTRRLSDFLHTNVDEYKTIVLNAINQSTVTNTENKGIFDSWLDDFCSQLGSKFSLSRDDLKSVKYQFQNITEIEFLKEAMTQSMDTVVEMCKEELTTYDMDSCKKKMFAILTEKLPGCWERCPFCGAVCTNTDCQGSTKHQAQFHRPASFGGRTQWMFKHYLRTDICSSLVSSYAIFMANGHFTQTYYRNYAKAGPPYSDWSIKPDNSALSYWKWVTCRFQSDIEKWYDLYYETIPEQWQQISKANAISEIEDYI
ncbi:interferon-induced very large GTPase 1-like isoform X2 [Leptodactylus fuscus]